MKKKVSPAASPKKKPANSWSVWKTEEGQVRVQINDPALAKAFEKVKGVERVGYSVLGAFTRIYSVQESAAWIQQWMQTKNK